jgi:hypothetical protein
MPLRCPPHTPFFFPTHLDCIFYSLHNDLNLGAKIDGNGPILMKIRLGEVWCSHDEFRNQHSPSRIFINIGLLSTYYEYNCSLWYHISSCESRSGYDIGVLFKKNYTTRGTTTAALPWFDEVRGGVWRTSVSLCTSTSRYVTILWPLGLPFLGLISTCELLCLWFNISSFRATPRATKVA